jgi:hypothetical protein
MPVFNCGGIEGHPEADFIYTDRTRSTSGVRMTRTLNLISTSIFAPKTMWTTLVFCEPTVALGGWRPIDGVKTMILCYALLSEQNPHGFATPMFCTIGVL